MPVEDILAAIAVEAESAVAEIEAGAAARIEQAARTARERAASERARLAGARTEAADLQASRIVNRARLAADRVVRDERELLFQAAIERVRAGLGRVRESGGYDIIFSRLLDEARRVLPDADVVRVDPSDVERARSAVRALGIPVRVEPSLDTQGGVELSTGDGRIVRNTFESRLLRATGDLRMLAIERIPELRGEW